MDEDADPAFPGATLAYDLAGCLRFYSRLPVPPLPGEGDPHAVPDFRTLPRMLPLAGLVLGLPGALVMLAAWGLGLGPFLAATLALTAGVLVTGALHEDGLADVADGFGGGSTSVRRLEIMRDSRIGAYGGVALMLSLALRIGALATLLDRGGHLAVLALVLAAALSRTACPGAPRSAAGRPPRRGRRGRRPSEPQDPVHGRCARTWPDTARPHPRAPAPRRNPDAGSRRARRPPASRPSRAGRSPARPETWWAPPSRGRRSPRSSDWWRRCRPEAAP